MGESEPNWCDYAVGLGANGEIPRALMSDLVHPTDAGYAIWAKAIRPYLEEVGAPDVQ